MATTRAPTRPQLCVGCAFYQFDQAKTGSLADPCRCTHPTLRDALGWGDVPASWARGVPRDGGRKRCGPAGELFEPAPARETWKTRLLVLAIAVATAVAVVAVWP